MACHHRTILRKFLYETLCDSLFHHKIFSAMLVSFSLWSLTMFDHECNTKSAMLAIAKLLSPTFSKCYFAKKKLKSLQKFYKFYNYIKFYKHFNKFWLSDHHDQTYIFIKRSLVQNSIFIEIFFNNINNEQMNKFFSKIKSVLSFFKINSKRKLFSLQVDF